MATTEESRRQGMEASQHDPPEVASLPSPFAYEGDGAKPRCPHLEGFSPCNQVKVPANTRQITSWTCMARSTATAAKMKAHPTTSVTPMLLWGIFRRPIEYYKQAIALNPASERARLTSAMAAARSGTTRMHSMHSGRCWRSIRRVRARATTSGSPITCWGTRRMRDCICRRTSRRPTRRRYGRLFATRVVIVPSALVRTITRWPSPS